MRTEGLWIKCLGCRAVIWKAELEANLNVCPKCQHHFKLSARQRIELLLEPGYELVDMGLRSTDPLNFTDVKPYKVRLRKAQEATGLDDAIINAVGQMGPHSVVLSAMEYGFIGGSMGAVVGETIARAADRATNWTQAFDCGGRLRWRAHDGRRREPDADGEDFYCSGAVGRSASPVYLRAYRSDDWRRYGEFCDARRFEYCGAKSADRVCWTARD